MSIERESLIEALRNIDASIERVRDRITVHGESSVLKAQEDALSYCLNTVTACCGIDSSEYTESAKGTKRGKT